MIEDKKCESRVGQGGSGGLGGSGVGEASKVECKATVEGERSNAFEGEKAIVEGERSSAFEGAKTSFEGEETSAFKDDDSGSEREQNFQSHVKSGSETDYIESSDVGSYDNLKDGEVFCKIRKKIFYDPKDRIPCLQLGLIFDNTRQFKDALVEFDVAKRFDYKLDRNEKHKVSAKSKGNGCPQKIYASFENVDVFFKVNKLVAQHDCSITFTNSKVNYKFIGKHF
ncbi:hypothetical protein V6N11_037766 [Hibiscus sabdariffa]|uniref:Transposase MuDR plant domain-containing protein n=1 Tax=Hibiscus sabdariffa TaxID=183260 RepID=A0ABR2PEG6_9ROSI